MSFFLTKLMKNVHFYMLFIYSTLILFFIILYFYIFKFKSLLNIFIFAWNNYCYVYKFLNFIFYLFFTISHNILNGYKSIRILPNLYPSCPPEFTLLIIFFGRPFLRTDVVYYSSVSLFYNYNIFSVWSFDNWPPSNK